MNLEFTVLCTILLSVGIQRVAGTKIGHISANGKVECKLGDNELFGQEISSNVQAKSYKIGTDSLVTVGTRSDRVTCTRLMADEYKDAFRTKIAEVSTDNIVSTNNIQNEDYNNYFVFIDREVWKCTDKNKESVSPIRFYRIVNVIQGVSEIYKLYYNVNDVQVLYKCELPAIQLSYYTRVSNANANLRVTSVVREEKYLDTNDFDKQLNFEGTVELSSQDGDSTNKKLSMFEAVYVDQRDAIDEPQVNIINHIWLEKSKTRTSVISNIGDGGSLRVGQSWNDEIGSSIDEATCVRINGYESDSTLPHVNLYSRSQNKWLPEHYNGHQDIPIIDEYFTITKLHFCSCTIARIEETFIRVETELMGRKPISNVFHYDGISVWKFRMNDKNDYSVKIKSVHYSKTDKLKVNILKYTGALDLKKCLEKQLENNSKKFPVKYSVLTNKIEENTKV